MNPDHIQTALKSVAQPIAEAHGLTPDLPNVGGDGGTNLLRFDFPDADREDLSLKGNETLYETGIMVMTVITEEGVGTDGANDTATALADGFPVGPFVQHAGFRLRIRRATVIGRGYPQAGTWRVPVRVFYEAKRTN